MSDGCVIDIKYFNTVAWYFKPYLRHDASQITKVERQMAARGLIVEWWSRRKVRREVKRGRRDMAVAKFHQWLVGRVKAIH